MRMTIKTLEEQFDEGARFAEEQVARLAEERAACQKAFNRPLA
jgi:hypothetical protein